MHEHEHDHDHNQHDHDQHDHGERRGHDHRHAHAAAGSRAIHGAFAANTVLLVVQVVGGLAAGSLALLGDSAHQATDVVSLALLVAGVRLRRRPAPTRHSYGRRRQEAVIAQASAALLVAAAIWVAVEAIGRLTADGAPEVAGVPVIVLAIVGLAINAGSAWLLSGSDGGSLLSRAAVAHLAADAGGSAAVLVVGIVIAASGWTPIDPIVSLALAAVIALGAFRLARDATDLLLDTTPHHLDPERVRTSMSGQDGVDAVHHLHLWRIDDEEVALSGHLVLSRRSDGGSATVHDAQVVVDRVTDHLASAYGIGHATLQVECHACDRPEHPGPLILAAPGGPPPPASGAHRPADCDG